MKLFTCELGFKKTIGVLFKFLNQKLLSAKGSHIPGSYKWRNFEQIICLCKLFSPWPRRAVRLQSLMGFRGQRLIDPDDCASGRPLTLHERLKGIVNEHLCSSKGGCRRVLAVVALLQVRVPCRCALRPLPCLVFFFSSPS